MPTNAELALGKVILDLQAPSGATPLGGALSVGSLQTVFGVFTSLKISDSEQLKVYYAPDSSLDRARFGALSLAGPGVITVTGILAATVPNSWNPTSRSYVSQGVNALTRAALSRHIWETVTLSFDFDMSTSSVVADSSFDLYDVKVGPVSLTAQGLLMKGQISVNFAKASLVT